MVFGIDPYTRWERKSNYKLRERLCVMQQTIWRVHPRGVFLFVLFFLVKKGKMEMGIYYLFILFKLVCPFWCKSDTRTACLVANLLGKKTVYLLNLIELNCYQEQILNKTHNFHGLVKFLYTFPTKRKKNIMEENWRKNEKFEQLLYTYSFNIPYF